MNPQVLANTMPDPRLQKRIIYYSNNNTGWNTYRWILFAVIVPVVLLSLLGIYIQRRRRARMLPSTAYIPPQSNYNHYNGYNMNHQGPPPGNMAGQLYAPPHGPPPMNYHNPNYNTVSDENHVSYNGNSLNPNVPPPVYMKPLS